MIKLDLEVLKEKINNKDYFTLDESMSLLHALQVLEMCIKNQYGPLIVGSMGIKDSSGLHDTYLICPKYGSDVLVPYKRVDQPEKE